MDILLYFCARYSLVDLVGRMTKKMLKISKIEKITI